MNLISRPWKPQDLLDDLQLLIDEEPDNYTNCKRATLCEAHAFLKDFFERDANETQVQQWISVEDRLPVHGDIVLCYTVYGEVRIFQWDDRADVWVGDTLDYKKSSITHWMPLPPMPWEG